MPEETDCVTVLYSGFVSKVTDKAVGLSLNEDSEIEFWIPISLIETIEYDDGGDSAILLEGRIHSLEVARWFAEKEGLA